MCVRSSASVIGRCVSGIVFDWVNFSNCFGNICDAFGFGAHKSFKRTPKYTQWNVERNVKADDMYVVCALRDRQIGHSRFKWNTLLCSTPRSHEMKMIRRIENKPKNIARKWRVTTLSRWPISPNSALFFVIHSKWISLMTDLNVLLYQEFAVTSECILGCMVFASRMPERESCVRIEVEDTRTYRYFVRNFAVRASHTFTLNNRNSPICVVSVQKRRKKSCTRIGIVENFKRTMTQTRFRV